MSEDPRNDPDRPSNRPAGPQMKVPRQMFTWMMILSMALIMLLLMQNSREQTTKLSFNDLLIQAKQNVFEEIVVHDTRITGKYNDRARTLNFIKQRDSLHFEVEISPQIVGFALMSYLSESSPSAKITYYPEFAWGAVIVQILLWGGLLFVMWFFLFRQMRNLGGGGGFLGNFGRSKHRVMTKEAGSVTFADVAGVDEAKEEVTEIVEFLKNPKKFQRLGGRIPRGVLLVGNPGCGKTMLAKAIAGEADVPFFSISGSDFVEMFVGVGASRVRDLFKQAKDNSPCIIFLDEIDAVGRKRGSGFSSGGHDEREQTLNAILVEMDGFDTNDQVIVIAATNRVDVLDPALTRPGRFDRQVYVPLPDVQGRYEILKVHARKIKCGSDVDFYRLARGTSGLSGADLAAIINESAILATMTEKEFVSQEDLEEARDKVRWGRSRKNKARDEKENRMVAFHEAGHAVLQVLQPDEDPLHKVSILPRGQAGGVTLSLPEKDRITYPKKHALARLRTLFGGRICEDMFCDDIGSGAQMDIAMATQLARTMVTEWGMSERIGPIKLTPDENKPGFMDLGGGKEYSEATAEVIDQEIKRLIDDAYNDARQRIEDNKDFVLRLVEALIRYETLDAADVLRIKNGETLSKTTIGDILKAESQRKPPLKPEAPPSSGLGDLGNVLPQPG